jgi:tetratricopeptide (TPR) repeat protein
LNSVEAWLVGLVQGRLNAAIRAGNFEEAVKQARQVATLRAKAQGKYHWEVIDARLAVERWERLARVPPKDRPAVLTALRHLGEGGLLRARRDYQGAERACGEALANFRNVLGEEHCETSLCYNILAANLEAQGQQALAQPHREKALRIVKKALGEQHANTAALYQNLACNLDAQGQHTSAQPLHRRALAIQRRARGERHPETAHCYNSLAHNLDALGDHARAQPLYQKALAIWRNALGEEHPHTALGYSNVAFNLRAQGQHAQAQPLFKKALAIRKKVLGEAHPDTATSYNNLAANLDDLGQHTLAQPLHYRALAIRKQVLGEAGADTAESYHNLAANLQAQGQHASARPLLAKALAIRRSVLGEDHPATALSYHWAGSDLVAQGKYGQAEPLIEKALAIRRRALGPDQLLTHLSGSLLAFNLNAQGKHASAQPLFEEALAICRNLRGEEHSDTAISHCNVGASLNAQGRYDKAQERFEKALAIWRKVRGEEHALTANGYTNLGDNLLGQGKDALAQPLFNRALLIRRKVLGEEHADTAIAYNNLAIIHYRQGKYAAAEEGYRKALAIFRKVLGEEHPDTAQTYNNLAGSLNAQGKFAQAAPYWGAAFRTSTTARLFVAASGFERALHRAHQTHPGEALAVCLARLGEPILAWQYAEASLARGLLDDLEAATTASQQPDRESRARLARVDALLVPLLSRSDLSAAQRQRRDEYQRQRAALLGELARQAGQRSARLVYPLERIQRQLPDDTALVLWVAYDEEMWGCVLRSKGPPRWHRVPGRGPRGAWTEADFALPRRFHRALVDPAAPPTERNRHAATLRQRLLDPLQPHLAARDHLPVARRLLVVSRGMEWLPLEVLTGEQTVSYVPSGTLFARLREQRRPMREQSLLALGDPVFSVRQPEPPAHGLLVRLVLPGSTAARAGLRSGDVLLRHGKTNLKTLADLDAASRGGPAALTYWRHGSEHTLRRMGGPLGVVLDERPVPQAVKAWRQDNTFLAQRGTGHSPLPGTRWEVEALARLVSPACTLLGSRASEEQLEELARWGKLKAFRLIHLATHGEVNETRPERSALILAQDRLPDPLEQATRGRTVHEGRLTVETIRTTWKLDADLVVLSACQTALGKATTAEGLLGFAQALLAKGARSVVLSRWKVDDVATALLMVRFYENLLGKRDLKKPMPRAEALQEARNWLRQLPRAELEPLAARLAGGTLRGTQKAARPLVQAKAPPLPLGERPFAHPYYWAAFVLIGDPE